MQLSEHITDVFRLTQTQKAALRKLNIETVRDLLFHFPARYDEGGSETTIAGLLPGMEATIIGVLEKLQTKKSWKRKIPVSEGMLRDATGTLKVMWFSQPYIAKMWQSGVVVKATGKIGGNGKKIYLANPHLERATLAGGELFEKTISVETGNKPTIYNLQPTTSLFAVYPESSGVTSLWFRHAIEKILAGGVLEEIEDPIPQEILKRYNLPSLKTALVWAHTPHNAKDAAAARKRFAFEEVFYIQLERQRERLAQMREKSFSIEAPQDAVDSFVASFPFKETQAQKKAIDAIIADMRTGHPMSRLLEGDVGSGKTAVAATAAYAAVRTRPEGQAFGTLQVAYMAPTEILAKQHFESFIKYFEVHPVNIGLITGSGCYKFPSKVSRNKATNISRSQLLKWVSNGEIPIVIGTHALIEKAVGFKHLALVIIDEQHRFGVGQRKKLARKEARIPHLLSMTATPIPRTLALTVYGDLDLTLLDEMPEGRKQIITEVVSPERRDKAYTRIRSELKAGRQAYVICPRIDEPDPDKALAVMAKSVKEEAKRLKKEVFPEFEIEILHSKMRPAEKDAVMRDFADGKINILVATSVVEVGVNVPNATTIFIEGAERFGLAQLHQLRGRVVRSTHQAYCFVCPETRGERTLARLKALTTAKNGFELAEQDLLQRGAGELGGRKQWGISDIGMEALENLRLVEAARSEAQALVKIDEKLSGYPLLAYTVAERAKALHFE